VGGAATTAATINKSYHEKGGVFKRWRVFGAGSTTTVSNDTFTVATGAAGLIVKTPYHCYRFHFQHRWYRYRHPMPRGNVFVSNSTLPALPEVLVLLLNGGAASTIGTSTFTRLTTALNRSKMRSRRVFQRNTVTSCGVLSTHDTIIVNSYIRSLHIQQRNQQEFK